MKSLSVCLYFTTIIVSLWCVDCLTKEEESDLLEMLRPVIEECMSTCNLKEEDMKKGNGDIDPCFKRCAFKGLGLINDKGEFDKEAAYQQIKAFVGNEEEAAKIQKSIDECFKSREGELKSDKDPELKRLDIFIDCIKN